MMGLMAKDTGGGDFELAPQGTHVARCYRVIDLGTQYSERWATSKHQVLINWELCNEAMSDGRPFMVGKKYTLSLSEKANLRKDLESWRGRTFNDQELKGFDLSSILNVPCYVNVMHNENGGRTYANVQSVMALPKGTQAPELQNPPVLFSIDEWNQDVFDKLGDGLRNLITQSQEYKARTGNGPPVANNSDSSADPGPQKEVVPDEDFDDEIPF